MDIQRLREYITLCKTLNFRSAAEASFISQSTLSKHVAALEAELGCELFVRDTKQVSLTEEGRVFRGSATVILEEYEHVRMLLSGAHSIKGKLRIAGGIRFPRCNEALVPAIAGFERKYPDVNISLEDIQWQDYREVLIKGVYDIIFSLHLPNINEEGLEFLDILEVPLCVWLREGAHFAGRDSVSINELAGWRLRILEERKCQDYMSFLRGFFSRHGLRVHMGRPLTQAFSLSDKEFGVTPEFLPQDYFGSGISKLSIEEGECVTLSIVRKQDATNPVAVLFFEEARSQLLKPAATSLH